MKLDMEYCIHITVVRQGKVTSEAIAMLASEPQKWPQGG